MEWSYAGVARRLYGMACMREWHGGRLGRSHGDACGVAQRSYGTCADGRSEVVLATPADASSLSSHGQASC